MIALEERVDAAVDFRLASHATAVSGDYGSCELTLQSSSFAGTCGQMVPSSTGIDLSLKSRLI